MEKTKTLWADFARNVAVAKRAIQAMSAQAGEHAHMAEQARKAMRRMQSSRRPDRGAS